MNDTAVKALKLNLRIGDVVEIDGRRYDVVSDKQGGITLEPEVGISARALHDRYGTRPATQEEFDSVLGHVRTDDEG
jgi:hypothetical protein